LGLDLWRNNPTSKYYDYRLINERLNSLIVAREEGNVQLLVNLLRSGLVRNLGNITSPKLFNRSFAGTKYLIEEYVAQVAEALDDFRRLPTTPAALDAAGAGGGIAGGGAYGGMAVTTQMKMDFIHDTRQAFGRSTLVLQGGSIFGICHLGVVKALFLRGLLPRIITGTATGALIAALVSVHTEEELPGVLKGDGIDLSAFAVKNKGDRGVAGTKPQSFWTRLETLMRRTRRFTREGYFLDVKVLEECVRANVGNITFEEAYQRSKRILNVTVATADQRGVPTVLNYLTAPNVVSCGLELLGSRPRNISPADKSVADLDGCSSLKCILAVPVRPTRISSPLQGCARSHCRMVASQCRGPSSLDVRLIHRPRLASAPHSRALQREPLHRVAGQTVPHPLPPERYARAVPAGGA
jgi:TAG lipase / lysophosphatidylethanolamine acyltransferase